MSQLRSCLTRRSGSGRAVALVLTAVTAMAACDRSPRVSATDSLLTRDLTLASSAAPAPSPLALSDTATSAPLPTSSAGGKATAPRTSAPRSAPTPAAVRRTPSPRTVPAEVTPASAPSPAPVPAAPTPSTGVATEGARASGAGRHAFGTGTTLVGSTNASLCSLANRPGDRIVATLSSDVVSPDGATLRAGTPILVEMATPGANGEFAFRVKAVQVDGELVPIEGSVRVDGAVTERRVSKGGDQGKVIGGAIAGAILGRVLGGGTKGTVIGAAGGAAAGTIAASRNSVTEKCLPSGATLTVTLSAPLVLTPGTP